MNDYIGVIVQAARAEYRCSYYRRLSTALYYAASHTRCDVEAHGTGEAADALEPVIEAYADLCEQLCARASATHDIEPDDVRRIARDSADHIETRNPRPGKHAAVAPCDVDHDDDITDELTAIISRELIDRRLRGG